MLLLKEFNNNDIQQEFDFFKKLRSENGFENPYKEVTYDRFSNEVIQ